MQRERQKNEMQNTLQNPKTMTSINTDCKGSANANNAFTYTYN